MVRLVGASILLIFGRVFSQRGPSGAVELRQPRKEKTIPRAEDRHKFIHDGKEYDRPPNLFDVGGGELKLLPEVLSDLNFESRDFEDNGTPAKQKELRDSRPWGRLYVDGWPAPIQYFRAHFGGPAVEGMRPLVLASPLDACEPLQNVDSAVVVATRGSCTYTTKAKHAQGASASSLLVVNNEEGILHPPGPDGKDLDLFSAMIPQAEGKALIDVVRDEPTQGLLVPMNCQKNSTIGDKNQRCHPAVKVDRELVDNLALGGFVKLPGGEMFEYLLADFGVKVPSRELRLGSTHLSDACTALDDQDTGKVIFAARGKCSFIDKAEAVGAGSGKPAALIVVNNETSLFHMGASPRWRGAGVSFPMLLVSDIAGRALSALPPDSLIQLTPSNDATVAAWDEIRRLREAAAWPKTKPERQSMFESLKSENEGFADRLSALREAFLRVSGGKAGMGEGDDGGATPVVEL